MILRQSRTLLHALYYPTNRLPARQLHTSRAFFSHQTTVQQGGPRDPHPATGASSRESGDLLRFRRIFSRLTRKGYASDRDSFDTAIEFYKELSYDVVTPDTILHGFLLLKNAAYGYERITPHMVELYTRCSAMSLLQEMPIHYISRCIGAMRDLDSSNPHVYRLFDFLALQIERSTDSPGKLSIEALSNAFFGLRRQSSDALPVRRLLRVLSLRIPEITRPFTNVVIGNCLYGMQNMTSQHEEVRAILTVLGEKIEQSSAVLRANDIACCLYGLQRMSTDDLEVRFLLSRLVDKINMSDAQMDGVALDNAIYGLKSMDAKTEVVKRLLVALTRKVYRSQGELSPLQLCNSLYGLQRMTGDISEVRGLFIAIMSKLDRCKGEFKAKQISCALFGIKFIGLGGSCHEVYDAIRFFTKKINDCNDQFTTVGISNCFLALRQLSSRSSYVEDFLSVITAKLSHPSIKIDGNAVSNMLKGIQNCKSSSESCRQFIKVLATKIDDRVTFNHFELGRSMSGMHFLDGELDSGVYTLIGNLLPKFRECKQV